MGNWAKTSVGLITFAFITLVLFIVLSGPINLVFDAIGGEADRQYDKIPPYPVSGEFSGGRILHFNSYSGTGWETNASHMTDGTYLYYANVTVGDTNVTQYLTSNNYSALYFSGYITNVYLRVYGAECLSTIKLQPFFKGSTPGDIYNVVLTCSMGYSSWVDISNDTSGPGLLWSWGDIADLDMSVTVSNLLGCANASAVELYVIGNYDYACQDWETFYSNKANRDKWYQTYQPTVNVHLNVNAFLNTLRTVFGLMFVLSMIGLGVWFFLGSHEFEYEETVNENDRQWRGF